MVYRAQSLATAAQHALRSVDRDGWIAPPVTQSVSPASRFGAKPRPAKELLGFSFEITDVGAALLQSRVRPIDVGYAAGLLMWSLQASDDPGWLAYYHPNAADYAQEPGKLCGAFGKRLFKHQEAIDQIARSCDLIGKDPGTRRGIAFILTPDDNPLVDREFPCAIAVQLFPRGDELHLVTYMRAQQVLTLLPYDSFLFMAMQCILADRLGLRTGNYIHLMGTSHYYIDEQETVDQVIAEGFAGASLGRTQGIAAAVPQLFERERAFRTAALRNELSQLRLEVDSFEDDGGMRSTLEALLLQHALTTTALLEERAALLEKLREDLREIVR